MNKSLRLLAPIILAFCFVFLAIKGMTPLATAATFSVDGAYDETAVSSDPVSHISNITGAFYDEDRGEIIIMGVADPDLPPMDYNYIQENLVLALASYYDTNAPDVPGVSIEGTEDPLEVIYFGDITDTHMANVSFEADRLLKIYTMGKDNITGQVVTSTVPGYQSYPERMSQIVDDELSSVLARYFFTPTLRVEAHNNPHGIVFSATESFVDWGYLGGTPTPATTQAAQGFVDNFNEQYWAYAAERYDLFGDTTLYEVIQLAKITAIAKWAEDEELELQLPGINDPWLEDYPITFEASPRETPGIEVTWTQTTAEGTYISSLRGGVYLLGTLETVLPSVAGQVEISKAFNALDPNADMIFEFSNDHSGPCSDPKTVFGIAGSCPLPRAKGVAYILDISDDAVQNGGFEGGPGSAPWVQISPFEIIHPAAALNGSYGAYLGGYSNTNDTLSQLIFIPDDATQARLTYWRGFVSGDPGDQFTVRITDANDNVLTVLESLDHTASDGYWHRSSFDLSSYSGQYIKIRFNFVTNVTPAGFVLDDISVDFLDKTNPTVANVVAEHVLQGGEASFEIVFDEEMSTFTSPVVIFTPAQSPLTVDGAESYELTPKSGAGYTNGFLDNDPTRWVGVYDFTAGFAEGEYTLSVVEGQDIAQNVMADEENVGNFIYDINAPQVNSTYPENNATNVPANAALQVTFNEAIDSNSFAYTVSPNPGGLSLSWNAEKTVATISHNPFTAQQSYNVTINHAQDLGGNELSAGTYAWMFATTAADETPPQINGRTPIANATHVDIHTPIVVSFNEPINSASFAYAMTPDPGGWSPNWNNDYTAVTITHNPLIPGTTYQISVTTVQDVAGNHISGAPINWNFTTGYNVYLPMVIR